MAEPRHFFTATRMGDGRVIVTGGLVEGSNVASSTEVFDSFNNTWSAASELPLARMYHEAVLLSDGRVLTVGGADASFSMVSSADMYDPATGDWASATDSGLPRVSHSITPIGEGRALAVGGFHVSVGSLNQVQEYRPVLGLWFATTPLAERRSDHTATLLNDGTVLVIGGVTSFNQSQLQILSSSEVYHPEIGRWSPGARLTQARTSHTATRLGDGSVLVAGGIDQEGQAVATTEVYRR